MKGKKQRWDGGVVSKMEHWLSNLAKGETRIKKTSPVWELSGARKCIHTGSSETYRGTAKSQFHNDYYQEQLVLKGL